MSNALSILIGAVLLHGLLAITPVNDDRLSLSAGKIVVVDWGKASAGQGRVIIGEYRNVSGNERHIAVVRATGPSTRREGRGLEMGRIDNNKWFGKCRIELDGQPGPEYDGVDYDTLALSYDGTRVAYAVPRGDRWSVVVDGKLGPEYDAIGGAGYDNPFEIEPEDKCLGFSRNGARFGYTARSGDKHFLIIDGHVTETENWAPFLFSADGRRLAYDVKGPGPDYEYVVLDGHKGERFKEVYFMAFSANGQHFAYFGRRKNGRWVQVVDGRAGPEFDLPEGERPKSFRFSADGKHLAYWAWLGKKGCMVLDGQRSPEYDGASYSIFSHDGKRFAYGVRNLGAEFVVVDGAPVMGFNWANGPVFSPDGMHVAYRAGLDGQEYAVIDGQRVGRSKDIILNLCFSPDGKSMAYLVWPAPGKGWPGAGCAVRLNGQEGRRYDTVGDGSLSFDASGKRLAYVVQKGSKTAVVVNGQEGPWLDALLSPYPHFGPDGVLGYIGIRGNSLVYVKYVPPSRNAATGIEVARP